MYVILNSANLFNTFFSIRVGSCSFIQYHFWHKVGCRYHAVKYNTTLHTTLQWLKSNLHQNWIHKRHLIPHPNGPATGCLFLKTFEKIDRVLTALHCIEYIMDNINISNVIIGLSNMLLVHSSCAAAIRSYIYVTVFHNISTIYLTYINMYIKYLKWKTLFRISVVYKLSITDRCMHTGLVIYHFLIGTSGCS